MTRNLLYSEGIGTSLTEPSQKRVTQRVYHAVIWKLQIVPELLMEMIKRRYQVWITCMICEDIFRFYSPAIDSIHPPS